MWCENAEKWFLNGNLAPFSIKMVALSAKDSQNMWGTGRLVYGNNFEVEKKIKFGKKYGYEHRYWDSSGKLTDSFTVKKQTYDYIDNINKKIIYKLDPELGFVKKTSI